MTMAASVYDLAVIGSGPAGQKAAVAAAKLGRRVVVVDRRDMIGGVCIHTGTIPSKALREAILYLSGFRQRSFYGRDYTLQERISVTDLSARVRTVLDRETEVVRRQLKRNGIETVHGVARFADPHGLDVETASGHVQVTADHILIACGTRPARSPGISLDGRRTMDSDQLLSLEAVPKQMIVVGAGVIGLEYASMLTALGSTVTVIDQRPTILDFLDQEMIEALSYHMRRQGATFRLGETVIGVEQDARGRVIARLESGKTVTGEALLYTVGRQANTDTLGLDAVGIQTDGRGRIPVNGTHQTCVPHIYAAGDVIGFPALAATSMEQARVAMVHAFDLKYKTRLTSILPYAIYTIPEMATVGLSEEDCKKKGIDYGTGRASYRNNARGQIIGDVKGMIKLVFNRESLELLGVHIVGENASELLHVGMMVMQFGGTISAFIDCVFNFPTLGEAYKYAAYDGLGNLALKPKTQPGRGPV
jgi:NAD(P) transhydrogenase